MVRRVPLDEIRCLPKLKALLPWAEPGASFGSAPSAIEFLVGLPEPAFGIRLYSELEEAFSFNPWRQLRERRLCPGELSKESGKSNGLKLYLPPLNPTD